MRLTDAGLVAQDRDNGTDLNRLADPVKSTLHRQLDGVTAAPAQSSSSP